MSEEIKTTKSEPIGYIQLEIGEKPVAVMNDVLLSYHYEKEENWEDLRDMVNIFVTDFIKRYPNTVAEPVSGDIHVHTQYQFFLNPANKTRNQDFRITGKSLTFLEFQNRAHTEGCNKLK